MTKTLLVALVTLSAGIAAPSSNAYFTPHFAKGQSYTDIYSKAIAITGEEFEPVVIRFSGSSRYVVSDANPAAPQFDETDVAEGRPPSIAHLEIRDGGDTNCFNGKCYTNNQTSGLLFIPLLWGAPTGRLHAGTTWTVKVEKPWEIGPAGTETVTVVSVDAPNHVIVLQRDGHGTGASSDDASGLPVSVNGKTARARIEGGASHWTGQTIVRAGIILSDEILLERTVTLTSELGTFSGHERVYTLLNAAPSDDSGHS